MKKILLLSVVLFLGVQLSYAQSDGVCEEMSTLDDLVGPENGEVCTSGPNFTFSNPASSLPDLEYMIVVNDEFIGTSPDGNVDVSQYPEGSNICVTAVAFDVAGGNDLLTAFMPLCPVAESLELVPPGTCVIIDELIANGGIQALADVVIVTEAFGTEVSGPEDLAGAVDGINAQVGAFGLPFICYAMSTACYTTINCVSCPTVVSASTNPTSVCSGGVVEICVTFDGPADEATVEGIGVAVVGDTQICYSVTSTTIGCEAGSESRTPAVVCTADGSSIGADPVVWTINPTFTEQIIQPDCNGNAGSAVLVAADGTVCSEVAGSPGTFNECPSSEHTDALLTYDFSSFNNDCSSFSAGEVSFNCEIACAGCATYVATTVSSTSICSGGEITICLEFDGPVNDIMVGDMEPISTGENSICFTTTAATVGCEPFEESRDFSVTCVSNEMAITVENAVWTTMPVFTEEVIGPDCDGTAPIAQLIAADGTICAESSGEAGMANECPDLDATPGTLSYDFSSFSNMCSTLEPLEVIADCEVECATPPTIDDFDWLSGAIPNVDDCCAVGLVTAYYSFEETFLYFRPSEDCDNTDGYVTDADGNPVCDVIDDLVCIDSLGDFIQEVIWECGDIISSNENLEKDLILACYPNPASEYIYIEYREPVTMKLYDVNGKLLQAYPKNTNKINTELFENGMYLLQFANGESTQLKKIFIQK